MITLVIEASTYVGSVALLRGTSAIAERTVAMRGREHEALMPAVADVLGDAGISVGDLGRVVCGAGPGAFTSLRIAGGIAKGLALSCGLPLVPVPSLALIVAAEARRAGVYLAAIDAVRGESYVQEFQLLADGDVSISTPVAIVPSSSLDELAASRGAVLLGPGQPGSRRADPHARGAARLTKVIGNVGAADLAAWEPAYGRLAEAQVKWEAAHGRPLVVS